MAIRSFQQHTPKVGPRAFVDRSAVVLGDVEIGEDSSVWPLTVIRGDMHRIRIGARTSVQDGSVLHSDPGYPLTLGADVTIGHMVMLHGCTIGDGTLVGIGAVVLNGAKIGRNCLVGAGALVTEGKEFPDNSMIVGAPAKAIKELTPEQAARMRHAAEHYVENSARYRKGLKKIA